MFSFRSVSYLHSFVSIVYQNKKKKKGCSIAKCVYCIGIRPILFTEIHFLTFLLNYGIKYDIMISQ